MYIFTLSTRYHALFLYILNNFILGWNNKMPKVLYFTSTCCMLTLSTKIKYENCIP